jgi:hypothetical protein
MSQRTEVRAGSTGETGNRALGVCGYVERPFPEVVDAFASPATTARIAAALGAMLDSEDLVVDLRGPVVVSARAARVYLTWDRPDRDGPRGEATLSVLAVRSGREALTELLLSVPADSEAAESSGAREFLDRLAAALPDER